MRIQTFERKCTQGQNDQGLGARIKKVAGNQNVKTMAREKIKKNKIRWSNVCQATQTHGGKNNADKKKNTNKKGLSLPLIASLAPPSVTTEPHMCIDMHVRHRSRWLDGRSRLG